MENELTTQEYLDNLTEDREYLQPYFEVWLFCDMLDPYWLDSEEKWQDLTIEEHFEFGFRDSYYYELAIYDRARNTSSIRR